MPFGASRAGLMSVAVDDIPDSEDLQIHADASDKTDVSSTWETGIGPDLSAVGSPSIQTDEQNGNNAVRYDGENDGHSSGSFTSSQTQPNHLFVVFRARETDFDATLPILATEDDTNRQDILQDESGDGEWGLNSGSNIRGGSTDTNWHIASALFNGSNSTLRIDGTQVASGDAGSDGWPSLTVAYLDWASGNEHAIDVGEILGYQTDKSDIVTDIESYLNDKWAVF